MKEHRQTTTKKKHGNKGALIKGMSKRLPIDILDSPIFEQHLKALMRGYAGVYALYHRKHLYYVGLSINLLGRIKGHRKDRHKNKWDQFTIFRIHRVSYLKDLETLLQNLVETPGNTQTGKVPLDANFNHALHKILRVHKKFVKSLERDLKRR